MMELPIAQHAFTTVQAQRAPAGFKCLEGTRPCHKHLSKIHPIKLPLFLKVVPRWTPAGCYNSNKMQTNISRNLWKHWSQDFWKNVATETCL